ncbi:MAG: Fis family transcriptional regulator [Methylococcaceae bacterium]|nr:Fis family transcriptional regulator [Methylococcaceae bacterium]
MKAQAINTLNGNGNTLSAHVRHCVEDYFAQLDGHDSSGLYSLVLAEVEKPLLETALKHSDFNQSKAAKILGLSRSTLRKKLELYGIG